MRLDTKNWLRLASVVGLAALLSACCAYERRAPRTAPAPPPVAEAAEAAAPMEAVKAAEKEAVRGNLQHWNGDNHWNRHPYR